MSDTEELLVVSDDNFDPTPRLRAFAENTGDGCHWGVTDWYPELEAAIIQALEAGVEFTTGWYGCKKEIHSACISVKDGEAHVEVSAGMDDTCDLVDTAVWKVFGGNAYAGSGFEAAKKHFQEIGEPKADEEIEKIFEQIEENSNSTGVTFGDENYANASGTCEANLTALTSKLNELMDEAEGQLDEMYEGLVSICRSWFNLPDPEELETEETEEEE